MRMPEMAHADVTGKRNGVDDADLFVAFYYYHHYCPSRSEKFFEDIFFALITFSPVQMRGNAFAAKTGREGEGNERDTEPDVFRCEVRGEG